MTVARLNVTVSWIMTGQDCICSWLPYRKVNADVAVEVRALDHDSKPVPDQSDTVVRCGDGADLVVDDARRLARSNRWGFVLVDHTGLTTTGYPVDDEEED